MEHKEIKTALIFGGGAFSLPEEWPLTEKADLILAADHGADYAVRLGLSVDVVVGDLDSLAGDVPPGAELVRLRAEKDDTDLAVAIKEAVHRGARKILLLCCFGGRADQTLATYQTMLNTAEDGIEIFGLDETTTVSVATPEHSVTATKKDRYLSVFCLGEQAKGVTIQGVKYPLDRASLSADYPLGVSNEIVEDHAAVSVEQGALLVMTVKK